MFPQNPLPKESRASYDQFTQLPFWVSGSMRVEAWSKHPFDRKQFWNG